jgi:uncharacterized spore protein YtfJ
MALRDLVGGLMEASTVKRVFGQPVERDGVVIIPAATVRGAFGGGEGETPAPADGPGPKNWCGGGAWSAAPAGAYMLKDGTVTWVPAVDANRTILLGCVTGIVSLLVIRSIARTVAKRG